MNLQNKLLNLIRNKYLYIISSSLELLILLYLLSKSRNELAIQTFSILVIAFFVITTIIKCFLSKASKKKAIVISTFIFTFISAVFYIFSGKIYSINENSGLLNYIIYAGKIVLIASPILGFALFIKPEFNCLNNKKMIIKTAYYLKDILLLIISLVLSYYFIQASYVFWAIPLFLIIKTIINTITSKLINSKK